MTDNPLFKTPKQARSRARVAAILQATRQEIAEVGVDGVSLTRVAESAEVPIGSVYQYFDGLDGLLACLMHHDNAQTTALLQQRFAQATSIDDVIEAAKGICELFAMAFRADPVRAQLHLAHQAREPLRALDRAASREHGRVLFQALRPLVPARTSDARLQSACELTTELMGSVASRASNRPEHEGVALVAEFEAMAIAYLRELARD